MPDFVNVHRMQVGTGGDENVDIGGGETNKEYFFDWQTMRGFDPDTISKTRDVRSMNEILTIFMQCRFDKSDYLFVRNRDIFQILRLLWICINYQLEMQERFKYHFSKLKEKNAALRRAEKCTKSELIKATAEINKWKYGDRCPVCEAACDSKESVDAHVQEFHGHLYEHWMCVRNNEPGKTDQENHKLKHEVATLRDQVKRYEREQSFRTFANLDDRNTDMPHKRNRRLETNTNIFSLKPPYEPIPQKEPELKTWRMAERYLLPKNRYKDPPECIEQVTDRIAKLMFPHGMGVKEEAEKIHRKYQRSYEVDEGYIVGTNYVCGRLSLGGYTHFQSVFEAPPSEDHGQFSNAEYSGSEDPGVEQLIDEYKSKELKKLQKKAQDKMSRMHITAHDIIDAARKMTNTPKLPSDMVTGHAQSIADNLGRQTHGNQSKDKDPGECSMVSLGSSVSGGARPAKVSTTSGSDKTEIALRPLTSSSSSGIPKNPPAASVINLERQRKRRRQSNQMNEFQSLSDSEELRPLSDSDDQEKPKRRRHRVHRKMELSDEPASSSGDQEEEMPQKQRRRRNSIQKVEHQERMKARPMTHRQLEPLEEEQTKRNLRQKPKTHHQMEKLEDLPNDRDKKGRRMKRQIEESLSDDPGEKKQRQRMPPQKQPKIKQKMEDFDSLSDEEKAKQKPKSHPQMPKRPLQEQKQPKIKQEMEDFDSLSGEEKAKQKPKSHPQMPKRPLQEQKKPDAPNQAKKNENPPPLARKDPNSEPRAPEVTTPPKPKPKIHQKLEPMEEPTSKANPKEIPPTKQPEDAEKEPRPKGIIPKPKPKEEPVSEAKRMATAAQSMRDAIAAASMRMYAAAQQPPSPPKPKPVEEPKPQEANPPPQAKPPEPVSKPKQEPQKPKHVVVEDDYEESPSSEKQENPAPEPPREEVKEEPESNSGLDASDNEFIALLTGM